MKLNRHSVIIFFARFTVLIIVCLPLWWLMMPHYALCIGRIVAVMVSHTTPMSIEAVSVSNAGDAPLNTGTALHFTIGGIDRTLPDVGQIFTNIAPFVALVLATAGLGFLRRLKVLGIGCAVLVATHIVFLWLMFILMAHGQRDMRIPLGQFFLTLPFPLWILLAYWNKIASFFKEDAPKA